MVQERVRFIKDTGLYEDGQMILERYGEKYKLTYFKKLLRKKGIEQAIEKPPVSAMEQKWDEYLELMAWIRATEHEPPLRCKNFWRRGTPRIIRQSESWRTMCAAQRIRCMNWQCVISGTTLQRSP